MFLTGFCSGARCITPPPVPPPEANLESPDFEESGGLVDFRQFSYFMFLIVLRYFTLTSTTKPPTNVKLGGSTCAWTKIQATTGRRNLELNVSTGMFQPGRNLIGPLAHQVSFG